MASRNGCKKLGLLGTRQTMQGNFLHKRFKEQFGIVTVVPEEEYVDEIHQYISQELTRGKFTESAKSFFLDQIQLLKEKGVQGSSYGMHRTASSYFF